jgi:hypothetical protein
MAVLAAILLGSGCAGSSDHNSDKPKPSSSPVASPSYEGGEVKDVGCGTPSGEGAITYAGPVSVRTSRVRGTLDMRKSTMGGPCDHVLWGRFIPAPTSKGRYVASVTNKTTGAHHEQKSADKPTVGALTQGTLAAPGDTVMVCVRARGLEDVPSNCVTAVLE